MIRCGPSAGTAIATFRPTEPAFLDTRSRTEAEARLRAAKAAFGRVQANRDRTREALAFAESQLQRYAELYGQVWVSRERLDTAEFEARAAREALNTAQFEIGDVRQAVSVARATLVQAGQDEVVSGDPITIRSPINGIVLRRLRESEAVVPAGEPLVEIGDTSQIEIVSDLLSEDAVQVRTGYKVLIEQWGAVRRSRGVSVSSSRRVTRLSALGVEEQRVNVVIDFDDPLQAAQFPGDGYRVEARVVIRETDSAVITPTSSLFRTGDDWSVSVVSGGIAELRIVEVGHRNGTEAEVLSGLSGGETVIVHPVDEIADGVEVVERGSN